MKRFIKTVIILIIIIGIIYVAYKLLTRDDEFDEFDDDFDFDKDSSASGICDKVKSKIKGILG